MKKVLCIIEGLGPGGAERQLCGLAVMLKERGFQVKLVYYVDRHFFTYILDENKVAYSFIPELRNKWLRAFRLRKLIRSERADCVVSFLPSVNMAACISKLFCRFFLIVSERNTSTYVDKRSRVIFNLYRLANCVVVNSYSQKAFIHRNYPFLDHRVKVITNFVDTDLFVLRKGRCKNLIPHILTIGRFTPQKNCLNYLKAIKLCKDSGLKVHFDWYGNKLFDKAYFQKVIEEVGLLGISDVVSFYDHTPDVVSLYQQSDVFCLPSQWEGFPNVICEAMSCGLPVICSNVCDNPKIVIDGINGFLFDPRDFYSMKHAVEQILGLPDSAKMKMGGDNRKRIMELCSGNRFVRQYVNLICS